MRIFLITTFILFGLLSCGSKEEQFASDEEFQDYLNNPDNGYILATETDDMTYDVKLTPPMAGDSNAEITVQLRINRKDGGSVLDFGGATKSEALEKEGYLSFDLMTDVYLEDEDQVIPCSFHHYERNYGLKPSLDILFRFKAFEPKGPVTFVYRDQLFDQGLVRLKFDKELFNSCYVKE